MDLNSIEFYYCRKLSFRSWKWTQRHSEADHRKSFAAWRCKHRADEKSSRSYGTIL